MTLLINAERFQADFDALAQIGATGDGGVNRPALSAAHLEARAWFLARAAAAGLETRVDSAGNHSAILPARSPKHPQTRTLLLGSHLDSVPNGGRFDGALGALAALEALRMCARGQPGPAVEPGSHRLHRRRGHAGGPAGQQRPGRHADGRDPGGAARRAGGAGGRAGASGPDRGGPAGGPARPGRAWRATWSCTSSRGRGWRRAPWRLAWSRASSASPRTA